MVDIERFDIDPDDLSARPPPPCRKGLSRIQAALRDRAHAEKQGVDVGDIAGGEEEDRAEDGHAGQIKICKGEQASATR